MSLKHQLRVTLCGVGIEAYWEQFEELRAVLLADEHEVKNAVAMKIMDAFGVGGSFTEYNALDYDANNVPSTSGRSPLRLRSFLGSWALGSTEFARCGYGS